MSSPKDHVPNEVSSQAEDLATRQAQVLFEQLNLISSQSRSYFDRLRNLTDSEEQPVFLRLYHSTGKWQG